MFDTPTSKNPRHGKPTVTLDDRPTTGRFCLCGLHLNAALKKEKRRPFITRLPPKDFDIKGDSTAMFDLSKEDEEIELDAPLPLDEAQPSPPADPLEEKVKMTALRAPIYSKNF